MTLPPILADKLICRPDAPAHCMRLKPAGRRVTVRVGGDLLARTDGAVRVTELGRDVYDPVLYIPRKDVKVALEQNDLTTLCPLKGAASYFDAKLENGQRLDRLVWAYETPLEFAAELAGLVAFFGDRVAITEEPLGI